MLSREFGSSAIFGALQLGVRLPNNFGYQELGVEQKIFRLHIPVKINQDSVNYNQIKKFRLGSIHYRLNISELKIFCSTPNSQFPKLLGSRTPNSQLPSPKNRRTLNSDSSSLHFYAVSSSNPVFFQLWLSTAIINNFRQASFDR